MGQLKTFLISTACERSGKRSRESRKSDGAERSGERAWQTRNSSGGEIANVNFLFYDIVHVLQNTIDSCINSATDRICVGT